MNSKGKVGEFYFKIWVKEFQEGKQQVKNTEKKKKIKKNKENIMSLIGDEQAFKSLTNVQ